MSRTAIIIRNAAATDFGGGERVPVFFARELKKHGVDSIVFSRSKKLLAFAASQNVPFKRTWWWSRQNWSGVRALLFPIYVIWQIVLYFYYLVQFVGYRPKLVHIQSKDDFIAGTLAARTLRIRVIWSDHSDLKHIFRNHKIWYKNPIGKLVYLTAHGAETIIIVSKEDQRLINEQIPSGDVRRKMQIIYNGAFDDFKEVKKDKNLTFLSTSRLVSDKGIGELITAFKKLREYHSDVRLDLVGDGPERKEFESLAKGTKDIIFHGYQTHPQDFLARADIFLFPTYHEGFSLALVEACMEELAVIATRIGGNLEIIQDGRNGLLVNTQNSDELYDAMKKLYDDRDLRLKLARAARKTYLNNFNFEKTIETKLLPLYNGSR